MMQKRFGAAFFAAALAVSALAGCGEGIEDTDRQGSTQKQESQAAPGQAADDTQGVPGQVAGDTQGAPGQDGDTQAASGQTDGNAQTADNTQNTGGDGQGTNYPEITSDEEVTDFGSVVVVGSAAYELYTYLDEPAESYAKAVNKVAENLDGKSQVYDLVIPLGSGITFPDNLRGQIQSGNQQEAVSKILAKLAQNVKPVNIYDSLMEHRNEYIYFRTDHHWTALGAYYAYEDFCAVKGIEPEPIDSYKTSEFDNFLGSFYFNDTDECEQLGKTPDVVTAYHPNMDAIMHIEDSNGVKYDSKVIYDEKNAAASLKYSCFIAGDNPYTEIVNNELTDGSSCVVVKESFGNSFVPFLVDHYQMIYVLDYRYWTGSVSELAAEKGADDVIFINNLSMIRNKNLVGKLYRLI